MRHHRSNRLCDLYRINVRLDHDVDAIDETGTYKSGLGGKQIHHREIAAIDAGHAVRLKKTPYGECPQPGRSRKSNLVSAREPTAKRKRSRENHRVGLAEQQEGIVDFQAIVTARFVHADSLVVRNVDSLDRQQFSAPIRHVSRRADERYREL